jgi:hypothetical protein
LDGQGSPRGGSSIETKIVYLMRGLPSCGKSFMAGELAGDRGLVLETDEFFYTQVGDDPARFDYRADLLETARRWTLERFKKAVNAGVTPIVVDRGNGLSLESQRYARYAVEHGYAVEFKEPQSPWWLEIRALLDEQPRNEARLDQWAERLAQMSRSTHRVPASTIKHRMAKWKCDLTVADVLSYQVARRDEV